MTDTKYFKVSVALEGESQLFHCTAVEIEGRIWLVPNWIVSPDGKSARPERIILLEQFQAQKIDPPGPFGENFAVNIPIPRALFDGPIPQKLKEKYVVEEQPDITFYDGETRH